MRILLVVAALSFCGYALAESHPLASDTPIPNQPERADKSHSNSNKEQKITIQSSAGINITSGGESNAESKNSESTEEPIKWSEWLTVIFTGLLVIVTGYLVYYTKNLWGSTNDLVKGAEKIAEKQLRAYIHGVIGKGAWRISEDKSKIVNFEINIRFMNAGVTPALDCVALSAVAVNMAPPFKKATVENDIRVTIPPGGDMCPRPLVISIQELTGVFEKKARVFIWGLVEYRDVFSKENIMPRHTEICLEVSVEADPNDPRLMTSIKDSVPPDIVSFRFIRENNSNS